MIKGVHTIVYSNQAESVRAFFSDVLDLPSVDAGGGWPIFALPPSELAVHPGQGSGTVEMYLMCDDIEQTMSDLRAKGVSFAEPVSEQRWGRSTAIMLADGSQIGLYEPKHPSPVMEPRVP